MEVLFNPTDRLIEFKIAGNPGSPVAYYSVGPGETCEVPAKYYLSGCIARIAPGLIRAADKPQQELPGVTPQAEQPEVLSGWVPGKRKRRKGKR